MLDARQLQRENRRLKQDLQAYEKRCLGLEANEALLNRLLAFSPAIIFCRDSKGRTTYVSSNITSILGYSRDACLAEPAFWLDKIHPADREMTAGMLARLRHQTSVIFEYRFHHRDGRYLWIQETLAMAGNGRAGVVGSCLDITEQRHERETTRESEEKYRSLFNDALDMIHILDVNGRIVDVNEVECKTLGFSRDELIGKSVMEIVDPTCREITRAKLSEVFRGKTVSGYETRLLTRQGKTIWVEVTAVPELLYGKVNASRAIVRDIAARKEAEENWLENMRHYQALFEDSPIPLWEEDFSEIKKRIDKLKKRRIKDFRTYFERRPKLVSEYVDLVKISDVNKAAVNLNGANRKEELTAGLRQLFTPDSFRVFIDQLVAIAERQPVATAEASITTLQGDDITIEIQWLVVPGYEESLSKVFVATHDVTERKRMEVKLRESLNLAWAMFDYSAVAIWEEDFSQVRKYLNRLKESGIRNYQKYFEDNPSETKCVAEMVRVVRVNQRSLELHGLASKDELDTNLAEWFIDDSYDIFRDEVVALAQGKHQFEGEIPVRSPDGKQRHLLLSLFVPPDYRDTLSRVFVSFIDITDHKLAERSLQESEHKYRQIVETANEGVWVIDGDDRTTFVNAKMAEMLGYSIQEMLGEPVFSFLDEDETRQARQSLQQRRQGRSSQHEVKYQRKDGTDLWTLIGTKPLNDANGQYAGALAMVTDITDRKRYEDSLARSQEQLRALAGHLETVQEEERAAIAREIHDEFGQILTVLEMHLTLLERELEPEKARVDRAAMLAEMQAMSGLIGKTANTLSKLITRLRPEVLDYLGLVPALEWQAEDFHQKTGIACIFSSLLHGVELAPEAQTAVFRILQEALTNITRHARASEVRIQLNEEDGTVRLHIEDNGRGITDEALRKKDGFGLLGMNERAILLGGELKILGVKDRGTSVTLTLPLKRKA